MKVSPQGTGRLGSPPYRRLRNSKKAGWSDCSGSPPYRRLRNPDDGAPDDGASFTAVQAA
ncbi:hypothetical protein D1BOALGB6SA_9711 [Olavius sp. associated proteobacterium Delta 1]|nr:hypothetical protein D1BOALGB6SA_9711 [Olavius sp. associated proteobacterium Delta 1]